MSSTDPLIKQFKKANLSDYPDVTEYECDLDAGLWVLWVYLDKLKQDTYLKANEIAEILRAFHVSIEEIEITRAFAPAGKKIHRQDIGSKKGYKIMHKGIEYLRDKAGTRNIAAYYFDGNKPRSDRKMLKDLLRTKGEIKIVDPYYGLPTLDILEQIDNKKPIKFLGEHLSGNATTFSRELVIFKRQFTNIELKQYPIPHELHDRYIITNEALILVGHGIKDLGGRESFVLVFKDQMGKEIKKDLNAKFDQRWQNSQPIQ